MAYNEPGRAFDRTVTIVYICMTLYYTLIYIIELLANSSYLEQTIGGHPKL